MAHFAELDDNDVVLRVIVVNNAELMTEDGKEDEAKGIEFCQNLLGGNWVQTSYNGNFRKRYAGIGYKYDRQNDAFISLQPFPSWVLNSNTLAWEAPISYPTDGNEYFWNEDIQNWELVNLQVDQISEETSGLTV